MRVTTWTLESRTRPGVGPSAAPDGTRIERVVTPTPELVRFLYAMVGGPWRWTDRLGWSRKQWADELAAPGSEVLVAYADGAPAGYVQLGAGPATGDVEIRYFGLLREAIGRGLGRVLLESGIAAAWSLSQRHGVRPTARVWVHTCDLDGPAALANYRARGLDLVDTVVTEEDYPPQPLGTWRSSTGLES